jgi:hypothetical protein
MPSLKSQISKRSPVIVHCSLFIVHLSFVISLVLLVAFSPRLTVTGDSDLTMDFERMPYLHHNPDCTTTPTAWILTGGG